MKSSLSKKSIAKSFICLDCKIDCSKNHERDYYMVKDSVWKSIHDGVRKAGQLCMDCCENRLGRKLEADDIKFCHLTLVQNKYTSALLYDLKKSFINPYYEYDDGLLIDESYYDKDWNLHRDDGPAISSVNELYGIIYYSWFSHGRYIKHYNIDIATGKLIY